MTRKIVKSKKIWFEVTLMNLSQLSWEFVVSVCMTLQGLLERRYLPFVCSVWYNRVHTDHGKMWKILGCNIHIFHMWKVMESVLARGTHENSWKCVEDILHM